MSDRKGIAVMEARAAQADSVAAPQFEPILTDAGGGHTFTMLGTSMRFIATGAGPRTILKLPLVPRRYTGNLGLPKYPILAISLKTFGRVDEVLLAMLRELTAL